MPKVKIMKMLYCRNCGKKNIKRNDVRRVCNKCAKKKMDGTNIDKSDGQVVYGLYNADGELLYIGVTNSGVRRTAQHIEAKVFTTMKVIRRFTTRQEADAFEIFSIWYLNPPLNIKRLEPFNKSLFSTEDLQVFGKVATSAEPKVRACPVCGTIVSRYNESKFCRRHKGLAQESIIE